MSSVSKDDRLVELMTEFLETGKPKQDKEKEGFGQPGLDNKKMLDAIQEHRNEIDNLKEKLRDLGDQLKTKKQPEAEGVRKITAPEIIALQSSITNHTTQIGDLVYKQKMLKTDIERKKQPKSNTGFGLKGWLLVASNVLLWSVVGFFLWHYFGGGKVNSSAVAKNDNVSSSRKSTKNAAIVLADSTALSTNQSEIFNEVLVEGAAMQNKEMAIDGQLVSKEATAATNGSNQTKVVEATAPIPTAKKVVATVAPSKTTPTKNKAVKTAPIKTATIKKVPTKKTQAVAKKVKPIVKKERRVVAQKPRTKSKTVEQKRASEPSKNEVPPDVTFGD